MFKQGFVEIENATYFIEPINSEKEWKNVPQKHHRRRRALLHAGNHQFEPHRLVASKAFNFKVNEQLRTKSRRRRSVLIDRYIETLVVADHYMFKEFATTGRNLELYILAIFNMVSQKKTTYLIFIKKILINFKKTLFLLKKAAKIFQHPSIGAPLHVLVKEIIILENDDVNLRKHYF